MKKAVKGPAENLAILFHAREPQNIILIKYRLYLVEVICLCFYMANWLTL